MFGIIDESGIRVWDDMVFSSFDEAQEHIYEQGDQDEPLEMYKVIKIS